MPYIQNFNHVVVHDTTFLPDCHWCKVHGGIHEPAVGSIRVGKRKHGFVEHLPACEGHLNLEWTGGTVVLYRMTLSDRSM